MNIEMLKDWVRSKLGAIVQYGTVTATSSNGADAGEGRVGGTQLYTRRMGPWGLRSVPPVGSEWVGVSVGGSSANLIQIAAESTKLTSNGLEYAYGPKDLGEGEVALYAKSGSVVRMSADGSIKIDAAAGADVVVNGGTSKVARVADSVNCGSLVAVVAAAGPAFLVGLAYVDPNGTTIPWFSFTVPAATPGTYPVSLSGTIHPGADHFKA